MVTTNKNEGYNQTDPNGFRADCVGEGLDLGVIIWGPTP